MKKLTDKEIESTLNFIHKHIQFGKKCPFKRLGKTKSIRDLTNKFFVYCDYDGPLNDVDIRILYIEKVVSKQNVSVSLTHKGIFSKSSNWYLDIGAWFEVPNDLYNHQVCI